MVYLGRQIVAMRCGILILSVKGQVCAVTYLGSLGSRNSVVGSGTRSFAGGETHHLLIAPSPPLAGSAKALSSLARTKQSVYPVMEARELSCRCLLHATVPGQVRWTY